MEKEQLRRRMALRMQVILESGKSVTCVSGHYNEEPGFCELCHAQHAVELLVIRNRASKVFHVAPACLREMMRFQVTDVDEMPRWLDKLKDLKVEFDKRKQEQERLREEERRRLEKKVIVRKRTNASTVNL